ncbi:MULTISPECIES: helix-turn-helix domain-containing protein [unclassified Leuconostoc]|uniref:helix-turn-helix domain-containing protein n=1 Tax=unclassified Leuconostoc TaxID=2685106 RepID=UPI001D33DD8B|nr:MULTISPECIES: helix-turn-helix transcriptional regulator [unclassified Leuconostoc]MBK0051455.1 helix-turn-helix transcriptional regulator [Leuconostoc sp. S50]
MNYEKNDVHSVIPYNIKSIRILHCMTQKELSVLINVSEATISHYESGTRTPDIETMIAIADIFDVSVDFLINHNTDKNKSEFDGK